MEDSILWRVPHKGVVKLEVLKMTKQEDGSVDLEINLSYEEMRLLIEYAIRHIMKDYISEMET